MRGIYKNEIGRAARKTRNACQAKYVVLRSINGIGNWKRNHVSVFCLFDHK